MKFSLTTASVVLLAGSAASLPLFDQPSADPSAHVLAVRAPAKGGSSRTPATGGGPASGTRSQTKAQPPAQPPAQAPAQQNQQQHPSDPSGVGQNAPAQAPHNTPPAGQPGAPDNPHQVHLDIAAAPDPNHKQAVGVVQGTSSTNLVKADPKQAEKNASNAGVDLPKDKLDGKGDSLEDVPLRSTNAADGNRQVAKTSLAENRAQGGSVSSQLGNIKPGEHIQTSFTNTGGDPVADRANEIAQGKQPAGTSQSDNKQILDNDPKKPQFYKPEPGTKSKPKGSSRRSLDLEDFILRARDVDLEALLRAIA